MMFRSLFLACLVASSARAITRIIDYAKVVGFNESVPDNEAGRLMMAYKPYLHVRGHGCVPFPAVDSNGSLGHGLEPTLERGRGCRENRGQIYARVAQVHEFFAIMYTWYMPRSGSVPSGRPHDWQNAVIFLNNNNTEKGSVNSIAYSTLKGYRRYYGGRSENNHYHLEYMRTWPHNYELNPSRSFGGMQPLIAWEHLTEEARRSLNERCAWFYEPARTPFCDDFFEQELENAYQVSDHGHQD